MQGACPSGILSNTLRKIDFNINILKFLGQAWPLHGSFPPQAPLFFRPVRKEPQEFIEGDKHHGQAIFLRGILEKQLVSQLKISQIRSGNNKFLLDFYPACPKKAER